MNPLAALGLVALGGLAYSAGYEVRAFRVRQLTVPVLPAGARPVRILHISDMHLTPRQKRKQAWLRTLGELGADFTIVTGDFWASAKALPALLHALEPQLRGPGAFVFGSNDYYGPRPKNPARYLGRDRGRRIHGEELPWQDLRHALTSAGWFDLTQRRVRSDINGNSVELRGVDDPHLQRDDYALVAGPRAPVDVALGVTHAPYLRILDAMEEDGVDLILSGHTHGGQLCLPGVGALVTNCDLDRRRAKGLHRHRRSWLHVSAGVGTNPFTPVRFACNPEATLLTLVPRA
ncbi:MAG: metallophosphoesterase [Candidatus Nanopelagicales bacterium]